MGQKQFELSKQKSNILLGVKPADKKNVKAVTGVVDDTFNRGAPEVGIDTIGDDSNRIGI